MARSCPECLEPLNECICPLDDDDESSDEDEDP